MKVLWVGDAVVSSGFACCTHTVCDHLHAVGHDVHVLGINYWGDPHPYPYMIYPSVQPLDYGNDQFGVTRLPRLIARLCPDVVVILQDPWNIPGYIQTLDRYKLPPTPIVGWIAVDAKNQRGHDLNSLHHVAVWTEFAKEELVLGGCKVPMSVIPLGVDLSVYYPRDRAESRRIVLGDKIPNDAFIFGAIGRNQPRKRLDLTLQYFSEWVPYATVKDTYLYLHVGPTGDIGCDIRSLVKYYNLGGRVILSEPNIGTGIPGAEMPFVYSALDCYATTTQGEGWGLPCLEAMACGVPCIVPDWSGLGSWTDNAAIKIPCDSVALSAPLNGQAYTLGGIPNRGEFINALDLVYHSQETRESCSVAGLDLALSLPWQRSAIEFEKLLRQVVTDYSQKLLAAATEIKEEVATCP